MKSKSLLRVFTVTFYDLSTAVTIMPASKNNHNMPDNVLHTSAYTHTHMHTPIHKYALFIKQLKLINAKVAGGGVAAHPHTYIQSLRSY